MIARLVAAAVVAAALPALSVSGAGAADSSSQLRTALGAPASVTTLALEGPAGSAAISTTRLGRFPRQSPAGAPSGERFGSDGQYLVLSSGRAADLFDRDLGSSAQPSTDLPGEDVASLRLGVGASSSARCLSVDVAMATEERVHTYRPEVPSDRISLTVDGDVDADGQPTEHARHPGPQLIAQQDSTPTTAPMAVNSIDYWHGVGDPEDRETASSSTPWLAAGSTPFDHYTMPETFTVPLPAGAARSVRLSVADVGNELLDSAALVDRVRVLDRCTGDPWQSTGVFASDMAIRGDRGIGNTLTLDPVASTPQIELFDDLDNGWRAGTARDVDLRIRWYSASGTTTCQSTRLSRFTPIADADRQSFVPSVRERGRCIVALVTGQKDGWRTETFPSPGGSWNPTLPIGNGQFVDTFQPAILDTGSDREVTDVVNGQRLTVSARDFAPLQDRFTYQWLSDGAVIRGATAKDLVVTEAQAGRRLSVRVTAKRLYFDDRSATSEPTEPVQLGTMTHTPPPRITGSPVVDGTLDWTVDPWSPDGASFSQVWYVDGEQVSTTRRTLAVKAAWQGKRVTVAVTGSLAGYAPVTRTSTPVTIGSAPMQASDPSITGEPRVGGRLTVSQPSWQPSGAEYTYTWKAGGVVLQTGTGSAARTLTVPGRAARQPVTVTVEARKAGYVTTTRTSPPTALVSRARLTAGRLTSSGRPAVGQVVRVLPGSWRPSGVTFRYRWYVGGRPVAGATRSSFRVPRSARGKRVTVHVTGVLLGYFDLTASLRVTSRVR